MKKFVIVIFDDFTDIDLFLMWDLLCRNKVDWQVRILGSQASHRSVNGLSIQTHGGLPEVIDADVVLFTSGKGTRVVINDINFLKSMSLDPQRQIIGSICSGALILASLGLLKDRTATTHPKAKSELQGLGVEVMDQPLVCHGNIATAGGCLSAVYLVAWVVEKLYGPTKRHETLKDILPVGQQDLYSSLIQSVLNEAIL